MFEPRLWLVLLRRIQRRTRRWTEKKRRAEIVKIELRQKQVSLIFRLWGGGGKEVEVELELNISFPSLSSFFPSEVKLTVFSSYFPLSSRN